MNTDNETKAAPDIDALHEKHAAAYAASSAAFEAWQKAVREQGSWAVQIANDVLAGETPTDSAIETYREACRLVHDADVEDDRVRAIARAVSAELDAARAAR